jgi:anti-sigma regulatory factor (Ser/Thr protein kinase)
LFDGSNLFKNSTIIDIAFKQNNIEFIGVHGERKGLYRIKDGNLYTLYEFDDVTGIRYDIYGNLFFGTLHNGLKKIKKVNFYYSDIEKTKNNNIILNYNTRNSTHQFNQSNLKNSLVDYNILDKNRNNNYSIFIKRLINNTTINIYKLNDINIYIDKYSVGYYNNYILQSNIKLNYNINDSKIVNDSNIILATKNGLYNYSLLSRSLTKKLTFTCLDSNDINKIAITKNGTFYLLNNSILCYQNKNSKIKVLNIPNTINVFNNILPTDSDRIVCILNNGFVLIDTNGLVLNNFFIEELNTGNNINASYTTDSTLVISNPERDYIIPNYNKKNPTLKTNIFIKEVNYFKYSNKQLYAESYEFTYHKNTLLKVILDIFNKHQILYYNLLLDNKIILKNQPIEDNKISIANLASGDYEIQIADEASIYKKINITIKPRWFELLLVQILFIFGILIVIFYCIVQYLKKIAIKKEAITDAKNRLFKLESFAKLNQLKSHFIFNALTPLHNYILRDTKNEAISYLFNFSDLLRNIMDMASNEYISITNEINFLSKYLALQKIEKSNSFTFEIINHNNDFDSQLIKIPTLLIQPLVENAINYGISSKNNNEPGEIIIKFEKPLDDFTMLVSVYDNGKGFFLNKEKTSDKIHVIDIIIQRLELLLKIKNYITINKTEKGFEISLIIPIK